MPAVDAYDKITKNGLRTLSENIADIGGFKLALVAYHSYASRNGTGLSLPNFKNYTPEQLFTLAYANILTAKIQEFCINDWNHSKFIVKMRARVNGVMANSKEFSRIWSCTADSETYKKTDDKCYVW